LVALPLALASPGALALGRPNGLDRIGGCSEFMRGDVGHDRRLTGCVRGMAGGPAQVPGRAHGVATGRPGLGHGDLTPGPGTGLLDRLARSRVVRPGRLEPVENMLRARRRPPGQKPVIRIGESSPAADRNEAWIADFRQDHTSSSDAVFVPRGGVPVTMTRRLR